MRKLLYSCKKEEIHPNLSKVFTEKKIDTETQKFERRKNPFYRVKFVCFIILGVLGFRHYDKMGILGYKTFLFDTAFSKKIIGKNQKLKKLLDIGAGEGSITEKFSPYTSDISCLEPAISFRKKLEKKGFKVIEKAKINEYDLVTLFNVLDRCAAPEKLLENAIKGVKIDGRIIISLPFPITLQSWDTLNLAQTNKLLQNSRDTFEKSVSSFYTNFLLKHNLSVEFFTRLPYIVALPEEKYTTIYDCGLFVCKK